MRRYRFRMTIGKHDTEFRRWREVMSFTQDQAADALGVSASQVKNWDAGEDRGRPGTPSEPGRAVRLAMAALVNVPTLEPWPETKRKASRR